ncbi:hypothetical protein [Paraconexibacter sp.]|uniref:hypothetical protein n=1 Tax=Paraconexibacter sp. TaxID=2949640 RepID=UPI00356691AD
MTEERHRQLQAEAVAADGVAHRALMAGDEAGASRAFARASATYAASWDLAPPASFGRLVGWMKAAILSGDPALADAAAPAVLQAIDGDEGAAGSPAAAWAEALAASWSQADERLPEAIATMRQGPPPFERAAAAVQAIADGDADALPAALDAIIEDFAAREDHLTGVAIADTAMVLAVIAQRRGLPGPTGSPVPAGGT